MFRFCLEIFSKHQGAFSKSTTIWSCRYTTAPNVILELALHLISLISFTNDSNVATFLWLWLWKAPCPLPFIGGANAGKHPWPKRTLAQLSLASVLNANPGREKSLANCQTTACGVDRQIVLEELIFFSVM